MVTVIGLYYNIPWGSVLEQEINIIIGGVFLGLSIFSYFYRAHLIYRRQKNIKEIKEVLLLLKSGFMSVKDKSRDELEHAQLEYRVDKIADEVKMNHKFTIIKMDSEFEVLNIRLNKFDVLFVRVEKLETDTEFIRASKRWKWVVGLALIGLITTVNFEQIKGWITKLIPW